MHRIRYALYVSLLIRCNSESTYFKLKQKENNRKYQVYIHIKYSAHINKCQWLV